MERKKLFRVLGATGMVLLVIWFIAILLLIRHMHPQEEAAPVDVPEVTLCDTDASGPCVVSFGTDNLNRMVINFQMPDEDYPPFYVKVNHGETSGRYECQTVEEIPTSVYCTGPRTPLGDPIDIQLVAIDGDKLLAEGKFVVSAIALPTVPEPTSTPSAADMSATAAAQPSQASPTKGAPSTPTPPIGYPTP
jgi:hypothetical protein